MDGFDYEMNDITANKVRKYVRGEPCIEESPSEDIRKTVDEIKKHAVHIHNQWLKLGVFIDLPNKHDLDKMDAEDAFIFHKKSLERSPDFPEKRAIVDFYNHLLAH